MQLDELIPPRAKDTNSRIQPFALDTLQDAFQLRESARVDLSPDEKGVPTVGSKSKSSAAEDKEEKKHKEKQKKEKRSHKHRSKDKEKETKNRHGSLILLTYHRIDKTRKGRHKEMKV